MRLSARVGISGSGLGMGWSRLFLLLLLLVFCGSALADVARGRVFVDANGNGRRDAGEAGVAGVKLSNGRDVVRTDADGRYRIGLRDGDTLFLIKPPGHDVPMRGDGLPDVWRHHFPKGSEVLRYGGIARSSARRSDFALLPAAQAPDAEPRLLVFADPQVRTLEEVEYYRRSIVEPARRHEGILLGLTLGDVVNDTLDLYPALNRVTTSLGIPWLHAPGNHDIDSDVPDDAGSLINFRRTFGPDTVAWELPGHAFIALDDVIWQPQRSPRYIGGLREDQFVFLENYLSTLADDTRVVMALHIPLFDDPGETFRHADRARLFELLRRFPRPLILSGHTHAQQHYFHGPDTGWYGAEPLHEYNVGANCGGYWSGLPDADGLPDARMEDGTPNGYAVLQLGEKDLSTRYHASRGRDDLRIGLTSPGVLRRGAYPAYSLYANVYGAEPDARVEYRIGDGPWQPMTRVQEPDPALLALNLDDMRAQGLRSFDRAVMARPGQHLWSARLPTVLDAGEHDIQVRARSRFEGLIEAATRYRLDEWEP